MDQGAERIFSRKLEERPEQFNIIPSEEFRLRTYRSSEQQALRILKYIHDDGIRRKKDTGTVVLDE